MGGCQNMAEEEVVFFISVAVRANEKGCGEFLGFAELFHGVVVVGDSPCVPVV